MAINVRFDGNQTDEMEIFLVTPALAELQLTFGRCDPPYGK
ncbi:hypothetical protein [Rhizobium leguminosarum]|nr:hypothetical protein [Rhizobium leguminosarum]